MNVSDESLDQYIYTRKLSFPPELERRFRDDYFNRSLVANRVGCVAGLVVTVAFGLLDRRAAPRSYPLFWGMR